MKLVDYTVSISKVKGVALANEYKEVVKVRCPETMEDIQALVDDPTVGLAGVCEAIFGSLKLDASGEVRRRFEQAGSPKANRASAQAWIMATQRETNMFTRLCTLMAGMEDTAGFLDSMYAQHGEAIRDWDRNRTNTYNQKP